MYTASPVICFTYSTDKKKKKTQQRQQQICPKLRSMFGNGKVIINLFIILWDKKGKNRKKRIWLLSLPLISVILLKSSLLSLLLSILLLIFCALFLEFRKLLIYQSERWKSLKCLSLSHKVVLLGNENLLGLERNHKSFHSLAKWKLKYRLLFFSFSFNRKSQTSP